MKIALAIAATIALVAAPAWGQTSAADAAMKIEALFGGPAADAPGCAVGVSQNGQKIVEKAFGLANLEHNVPNTTSTLFEIGSVSKQFTAAAVLLLERDGKLKLSDDIRKHLPEMPDYGSRITIEMLLNHTSGLRDWGSVANTSGKPRGSRTFSNAEVLDIAARQKALNYTPGAEYSYTNTGYNLLAIIVERVSGKSFMDFTRERLFEPLGMKTAQWRDNFNRIVKGRAMAYVSSGPSFEQSMPFMNVYGNGGLMMTIGDLTLWNEAMMADKLGLRAAMEKKSVLNDGREIPYARGVTVQPFNGVTEVSHAGSTGGYYAWLARYPDRNLSIAMLCNAPPTADALESRMASVFLGSPPETQAAAGLPNPASYAGLFVNTRTGFPLLLSAADGQLQFGGRPMLRLSETRWRRGMDNYTFLSADRLQVDTIDGNRFEYVRTPSATPTPAQLAEYAGAYASDDVMASYKVTVEGGRLIGRIDGSPESTMPLSPVYKDAFMARGLLARFRRDASGRVNALSLGNDRVRDLNVPRVN